MHRASVDLPIGRIDLDVDDAGRLVGSTLATRIDPKHSQPTAPMDSVVAPVRDALERYAEGDLTALETVEVAFDRGTPFQREVWEALRMIPPGTTISYAELAERVGRPSAFRAVGGANGANPIAIVVPCHRVVAADGGLGGYAFGLEAKSWLLQHEGALAEAMLPGLA